MPERSELFETTEHDAVRVSVDWLTLTAKQAQLRSQLKALGLGIIQHDVDLGERRKPFNWMSYRGERTRLVSWGEREDSGILILKSDRAQHWWSAVKHLPVKCTRIDIAVDFHVTPEESQTLAHKLYASSEETWGKDRVYSIFQNSGGGVTFYAGTREGDQMLRFYNKSAQQHRPDDNPVVWRCELEAKRKKAQQLWTSLRAQADPGPMAGFAVRTNVLRWMLPVDFTSATILRNATLEKLSVVDQGTTLNWLKVQVAPAVERLINAGVIEEVEQALGYRLVSFGSR